MAVAKLAEAYIAGVDYSLNYNNGNRSSKRTDTIHSMCWEYLEKHLFDSLDEWGLHKEVKVNCSRATKQSPKKKFSVDFVAVHKKTDRKVYFLVKSVEKSYNKNKENFANTTVGEVERLVGYSELHGATLTKQRKDDIIVFITLCASRVLNGNKAETIKYTSPHIRNLRKIHPNTHILNIVVRQTNQDFSDFEGFRESLESEASNGDDIYRVTEEIKENIAKVIRI